MRLFRIIGAMGLLCAWTSAHAQSTNAIVVAACGTPPAAYVAGNNRQITQDTTGALCSNAASGTVPTGAATSANQTNVQSAPGTSAATAIGVQGVTGGVPINNDTDSAVDGTTTTGSVTSATTIVSASTQGFAGGSFYVSSAGSGNTISFQQAWDAAFTTAAALAVNNVNGGQFGVTTTATNTGNWIFNTGAPYVRAIVTTYGSGTVTAYLRLKRTPAFVYNVPSPASAASNALGSVFINYNGSSSGAASVASILSPATPAGAAIKSSAGRVVCYSLSNSASTLRSVKLFNTASVTMGTTAAAWEIDIPAGQTVTLNVPGGIGFSTAIYWAVTAGKGLTDNTTTGVLANDVSGSICYALRDRLKMQDFYQTDRMAA